MRTALYSQPPSVAHGPFGAWTVAIAAVITATSTAAATGVATPIASSAPPAELRGARRGGLRLRGLQAEIVEEPGRAFEPVAAERAEQLLGTVPDEQPADQHAQREYCEIQGTPPASRWLRGQTYPRASAASLGRSAANAPTTVCSQARSSGSAWRKRRRAHWVTSSRPPIAAIVPETA